MKCKFNFFKKETKIVQLLDHFNTLLAFLEADRCPLGCREGLIESRYKNE